MNANVDQPVGNSQSRSFQSFVEAISRAMNLPASIWIPNDDKMAMRIDAAVGLSKEYVKKAELKLTETSVTGEAFLSGAAVTVYDILSDARWKYKDYAEEMGWKSALCVPIRVYGKIIGVISVYTFVNREFSENEKRLLEDYAAQIELTESYRRLFVLSENIERLITVEPKKVLEQIVRDACQVTGADAAVVYPFDPLREQFYDVDSVATFGLKHSLQLAEKPRIDKGMAAYIIHKGEAVFENIEVDEPKLIESSHFIQREEIKAFIGISLKVMDKVLGILYVDYRTPHNFSKGEKDTIRLFAHQAAIAVNNSRLFQQANLRADALEKLHQVGPDLLSITGEPRELESILNRIAQNAQTVLNADLVDLYQYDQSADEFVLPPVRVGRRLDKLVPKIIRDDDYVYDIVRTKKPTFTTDSQEEPILAKFKHEERARELGERFVFREQIKSTAALPMMVGQEVLGVIFVNFRIPQSFPEQQRELIGLFANQAAIAINNARLYQRTTVRAEALKSLHTVTSELVSITDAPKGLDKILNQIAESAHIVLGAELVDIYQYLQAENRFMLPPAKAGERIEPDIVKDKIYADDVLFVIVGGRVALYAQDARSSDAGLTSDFSSAERANLPRERFVVREKIASSASIPMIVNDEVVGVLFVNYRRSQSFLPPQRELIELFANQAAAAIRNARLYGEIQKRLGERLGDIETFREIYEKMHEGDLRAVLDLIAQKALGLTGAKYGGVWLLNKSHTSLTFGGLAGGAVTEAPPDLPVDAESENSINKQVVLTGKTYWCRDVNADDFYKEWYPDSRSEMAVPLKYQGRVIGTLNVESTVVDGFTEDHQKLLEALAGQAAIVVQNHRLVERLEILDRMGRELTSGIRLHENEILELIYQRASQLMDTDNMYIALYDDEEKLINFPVMYVEGKKKEQPDRKFGEGGIGKTEWIIQNKEPIFHAVKVEAEKWYKQPGRGDYFEKDRISLSSWVGVPMQVGEKVLGVIATYHPTLENLYGKDDLDVLSAMARQAAIAIDNARLYYDVNQSLEESNDRLSALVNFGEKVTSGINFTERQIIDLIYQQASQLMDTDNMYIALYDDVTKTIHFPLMYVGGKKKEQPARKFGEKGIGKTEAIIQNNEPIFHDTKAEAERWYAEPGHQEYSGDILTSWIGVPMQVGGKTLGVISTYHPTEDQWYTRNDLTILEGIARVAAIALENTHLYEEVRGEVIAAKQLSTLGTAIAALQHRINNTFNIIIPNVTRLRSRVDLKDSIIVEILDIIERNARYTSQIVSRIQEPLKEVARVEVNVNAIIQDVGIRLEKAWKTDTTKPFVAIVTDLDNTIPIIRAPSGQIAEVFSNLLDNSRKVMPRGGKIVVSSGLKDGMIYARVRDAGPGIPPSIQERLFEKPVPSREPGGGAGLGLWLSRLVTRIK